MVEQDVTFSRRTLLAWGGAAAGAAQIAAALGPAQARGQGAAPAAPGVAGVVSGADVERYMRLHASAADAEIPWYYTGRIYAVRERSAPVHLFNFEGTEVYWVRRVAQDTWTTLSSTLTFFRDRSSGAYLDAWANPVTGATVEVAPNVLRSLGGASRFSPAGYDLTAGDRIPWAMEANANGGTFWLVTSRYLARAPQPWIEIQTMMAPASELDDAARPSVATTFSSTYVAPWLRWMQMGDAPGHLVWHASGRKMASWAELPSDYRQRAERVGPAHFTPPGTLSP
jgi:hypothetical protein